MPPWTSDIPQVQADELEAVESILGPDFQPASVAPTAWASAAQTQPVFTLTIRPDEEKYKDDVYVRVEIRLPKRYPEIPLILAIPAIPKQGLVQNVSTQHLGVLHSALKKRATELATVGEEAVWEVYTCGSELLSSHNLLKVREQEDLVQEEARQKSESVLSLDQEKERREGEGQKLKVEELTRQLEIDRKISADKATSLAKIIAEKEEAARLEKERRRVDFDLGSSQPQAIQASISHNDQSAPLHTAVAALSSPIPQATVHSPYSQEQMGQAGWLNVLVFDPPLRILDSSVSRFQVSTAAREGQKGISRSDLAIPLGSSVPAQALDNIRIASPFYSTSRGRRKLAGLERELEALANVSHRGVRPIRGFQLRRVESGPHTEVADSVGSFLLSIVSAPRSDSDIVLEALLRLQTLPLPKVIVLARDLLAATTNLHLRGLLLKDITLDRVCLLPDQTFIIDQVWTGSVLELNRGNPLREGADLPNEIWPEGWVVPELNSDFRYSRKSDTFVIGRIILLSITGIGALKSFTHPWTALHTLLDREAIDETSARFLGRLLDRSARKRPAPSEALRFLDAISDNSLRDEMANEGVLSPKGILPLPNTSLQPMSPPNPPAPGHTRSSFFSSNQPPATPLNGVTSSRFLSDFVPLSVLGKGAFGIVTKVKNRLDGGVYAIKKIKLDGGIEESGGEDKTLREIGALARVNHPHVTRYYAAWIETATPFSSEAAGESSEMATDSGGVATVSSSGVDSGTETDAAMSFSFSFGPPKDTDFDGVAQAEEEDFLSHVGFEAEDDNSSHGSSNDTEDQCSSEEDGVQKRESSAPLVSRSRSKNATDIHGRSKGLPRPPRWLYIQMELVDDVTLRELIEGGPIPLEDCWRILRQILNALVHIHHLSIVHRDLKPSNILMAGQDVKIGDFGLATTLETIPTAGGTLASSGMLPPPGNHHDHHVPDSSGRLPPDASDDMTGEVGTALYTAPEIVRRQGARYGYKVDMYSLGIILFEMVASGRVYTTGMERVQRIRALRQAAPEFPPAWPGELEKERQVVEWLVTHKPDERPTPLQLLQSDLLPPRLEDESVQETLRLVTDSSSVYHLQLLDALFSPKSPADEEIRDVTFDAGSQQQTRKAGNINDPLVDPRESVVVDFLRTTFLRHGAIEMDTPLLLPPRSELYEGTTPVRLLDSTGQVVWLSRDHLVPFARVVARSKDNHRLKRFRVGHVYRNSLLAGGQPLSILAANMDIVVGSEGALPSAAEGECLACLEEILGDFPGFKNDWVILLNHGVILDLLLERVPAKQHSAVLSALSALSGRTADSTTTSVRHKLTQELNLPKSLVEELESCASMADDIETVQGRLERIMPVDHRPTLAKAIKEILEVREAAFKLGVRLERRFLLCPLLSNYSNFHDGAVFFQVARGTGSNSKKKRTRKAHWDVVASGGRYTSLIARFATPLSGPPPSGVGLQLAVSKLVASLAKDQEINGIRRPPDPWTPRRADVYVHSAPGMLNLRMAICRELWLHGIRADLSYEDDVGQESSMLMTATRCKDEGFSFLVFGTTRGLMKVRSLWTRQAEGEFSSTFELVPWLLDQLARANANISWSGSSLFAGGGGEGTSGLGPIMTDIQGGPNVATCSASSSLPPSASMTATSTDSAITGNAATLATMETHIVLPVHSASSRRDRTDKSNHSHSDRRVKVASNHPIINSVTTQVHRIASRFAAGDTPVIAVDLRADVFDGLCVAAMGKNSSRREFLWRSLLDTLSGGEERDYIKTIRGHLEKYDDMVILWDIREKRAAVVGIHSN